MASVSVILLNYTFSVYYSTGVNMYKQQFSAAASLMFIVLTNLCTEK